jgi:4-amino-4-deoxy-L-arabinose transferase-like glycosyltransferase
MDADSPFLLLFVVLQTLLLGALAVLLAFGFAGTGGAFAGLGPVARAAALLVVLLELAVPLAVYVDIRRRTDDPDPVWVHAAMMPVINILGLVAYLEDRQRSRE